MFKKWRPGWCYGIFPQELPWLRKRSGFGKRIGFMRENEWSRLWRSVSDGSVWRRLPRGRESGVEKRKEAGVRPGSWWREKGNGRWLKRAVESGEGRGECLGVRFALSGWVALYRLD